MTCVLYIGVGLVALSALAGGVLLYGHWYWQAKGRYGWYVKQTLYDDLLDYRSLFIAYNTVYGRMPTNLHEVVAAGFLPEYSPRYFCPMLRRTSTREARHYTECDYAFEFRGSDVIIHVPEAAFELPPYKGFPLDQRSLRATPNARFPTNHLDYFRRVFGEYSARDD